MKRKSILIVDRDLKLLEQLTASGREIGLQVYTAQDAVTAVSLLECHQPDLMCVEAHVPGGGGMTFCEMVLASPDDVACPVIILVDEGQRIRRARHDEMCVYYLRKRPDVWQYLEPVIHELVVFDPPRRPTPDGGTDTASRTKRH